MQKQLQWWWYRSSLTEEAESLWEEVREVVAVVVVDGDAEEVGLLDVCGPRTRLAHVQHVRDAVLLHREQAGCAGWGRRRRVGG